MFSKRNSLSLRNFKLYYTYSPEGKDELLFGISVPKKHFKSAVSRNRIKRHVREAYRINKCIFTENADNQAFSIDLMFVYLGKQTLNFIEIEAIVKELLTRLQKKVIENEEN